MLDSARMRFSGQGRCLWLLLVVSSQYCVACHEAEPPSGAGKDVPSVLPPQASEKSASASASAPRLPKKLTGKLDVTFFVASDTHLGFNTPQAAGRDILGQPLGIEKTNLRMIASMNDAPGRAYPSGLDGKVATPRGVLITGDLTENGGAEDWALFHTMYGRSGAGGPLHFPVFEAAGNHDRVRNWYVREQVARRHGGRFYSFDWDDLHLICLGEAPGESGMAFLRQDLQLVERDVPIVLYLHFPLEGPFSNTWWMREGGPDKLLEAIDGYRIVAIFHGHYHVSGAARIRGYDVYNVGSPKHSHHSYAVVQLQGDRMRVASYNYDLKAWWWWHEKSIALPGSERAGSEAQAAPARRSWVRTAKPGDAQPILRL